MKGRAGSLASGSLAGDDSLSMPASAASAAGDDSSMDENNGTEEL